MERHRVRTMIVCAGVLFAACGLQAQVVWYSNLPNPLGNKIEPSVLYDSTGGYFAMWYVVPGAGIMKAVSSDGSNWFFGENIVLTPGETGAFDHLIHSVNVVRDRGTYLMYYTASRSGDSLCVGLAFSQDGNQWQKSSASPVLGHGQKLAWDARSVAGQKVIAANGLYKMWYGGTDGTYTGTGLATSTDGVSWTKDDRNPVLAHGNLGDADAMEAGVMGIVYRSGLYYMIYRSIDKSSVQAFSLATSQDGANWTKYYRNPVLSAGGYSYGIGGGTLLWRNGLYHLWYCANGGGGWVIREAVSEPTPLSVKDTRNSQVPAAFLMQNYPNPFNPSTTIGFTVAGTKTGSTSIDNSPSTIDNQLGSRASGLGSSWVRLAVYDMLGHEVATLVDEKKEAGTYTVTFNASGLASGVYFYRLQSGDLLETRRLVVLK